MYTCYVSPADLINNTIIKEAVNRGLWRAVKCFINHPQEDAACSWAVEQAIELAGDSELSLVIDYCDDSQVDIALNKAVGSHLWDSLKRLMWRVWDDSRVQWAVEKASKHASDD